MSEKIVLIDGHSLLNRAFYGLPDLTNAEGLHTNAVYGFLNILFKILDEEQPQYLTVAFDTHAPTFRHKIYEEYKGTRKGMPQELREQVPLIKEMLTAMQIHQVSMEGYEADDLIGTLSRQAQEAGIVTTILSGDRDLLQLASDVVQVRIPKTKRTGTEIEDYYAKDVLERYQVTPAQIIELKALMGDSSDNIPGLPGVGEKTATKIITAYGTIENAYEHADEIKPDKASRALKEHYDLAQLSKTLATIDRQSPVTLDLDAVRLRNLFTPEALTLCRRLEFKNLLPRFESTENNEKPMAFEICFSADQAEEQLKQAVEQLKKAADKASEKAGGKAAGKAELGLAVLSEGSLKQLYDEGRLSVAGIAAAYKEEDGATHAFYVPVEEKNDLPEFLRRLCTAASAICVIDLKSALPVLEGIEQGKFFDPAIAAYLINPLKGSYAYDDIAKDHCGKLLPSRAELLGKNKHFGTDSQDEEKKKEAIRIAADYTCYQALTALESRGPLRNKLEETGMASLFDEVEMPLVFTLYDMQKEGIAVRREELKTYSENLTGRIDELEQQIYEKAGEVFNINSPKQLGVLLFEHMGLKGGKKTKTGYSTAADVLEKLAPDVPVVADILEYRQLTKLRSTYAEGLAAFIAKDGRIHGNFNQTITATGRISSTDPNLQNIPVRTELGRELRKVFVPKEGCIFADADYSQIELRVLAHMSGDEQLIAAYAQAKDIHTMTASQVFHIPPEEVTAQERRNAKAVNFGIVYGISSFGLSQGLSISRKEAQQYIEKYFETYPGIKQFLDNAVESAKQNGYSQTLYGRRRPVPELTSSNFMQRSFGERVAMNAPIQGTAADIIKIAMLRVHDRLLNENLRSRLLLQVHDELLVETWPEELEQVKAILTEEMMGAAKLSVSLEIDLHTGDSWYEAK